MAKTYDDFLEKYEREENPLTSAPFDGCMYETFDAELEYVKTQPNNRIWTIVEEEGDLFVSAGFHIVNRLGYFITKTEWQDADEIYKM